MDKIKEQIAVLMDLRSCWNGHKEAQEEINKVLTRLYDLLY